MYPRSFLCQEAKNILPQRNKFVKSVRMQCGKPESHALCFLTEEAMFFVIFFFFEILVSEYSE